MLVLECLDIREILFQEEDVLPIKGKSLYCKALTRTLLSAMSHHPMCTFADLLAQGVLVLKQRSKPFLLVGILL